MIRKTPIHFSSLAWHTIMNSLVTCHSSACSPLYQSQCKILGTAAALLDTLSEFPILVWFWYFLSLYYFFLYCLLFIHRYSHWRLNSRPVRLNTSSLKLSCILSTFFYSWTCYATLVTLPSMLLLLGWRTCNVFL